jgi:pantetheine-phosphate adenylyltransferase
MTKIAVFPGTFDPFTNGHKDIVEKGLELFDEIIIAIGINTLKKTMFPLKKREEWIENTFKGNERIKVMHYKGLTTDFCREHDAKFILRGLRTISDFEYERQIALVNSDLVPDIQSIFIMSAQRHSIVSSSIVRDLIMHNGSYQRFLPQEVRVDEAHP